MKIGIIGAGGAGLCTAWLLEQHHEVHLFERHAEVGGHAHTVDVERDGVVTHMSGGFNWFSDELYPCFMRFLTEHAVETVKVPMTASFWDVRRGKSLIMPPVGLGPILKLLVTPYALANMAQFGVVIAKARPLVFGHKDQMTLQQFVDERWLTRRFIDDFLVPFVSAAWGCPHERVMDSSVYPLFKYFVYHLPSAFSHYKWHIVKGGANAYARTVRAGLNQTTLHLEAQVRVTKAASGYRLENKTTGEATEVDRLVVATGAFDARKILAEVNGLDAQRRALAGFEYYVARVAAHSDPSWMPPNKKHWGVANSRWDGTHADMTIWPGWDTGAQVFNTYIHDKMPKDTHHVSTFNLPLVTPSHYQAQAALSAVSGNDDLFFAGDYTRDIGSHEDAIQSAVRVARALVPDTARLKLLDPTQLVSAS